MSVGDWQETVVVKTFYKNHVNIDFDLLAEKKNNFFFCFSIAACEG